MARVARSICISHLAMATTALLRPNAVTTVRRIASKEPLLPFLYNTRTIRSEHTDALTDLENSPDHRQSRPAGGQRERHRGYKYRFQDDVPLNYQKREWRSDGAKKKSVREGDRGEGHSGLSRRPLEGDRGGGQSELSRRPLREEHIPFEHAAQETMSVRDKIVTSTMTPAEKKAFEGLLSLSKNKNVTVGPRRDRLADALDKAAKDRKKKPKSKKQEPSDGVKMPEVLQKMQKDMEADGGAAQRVLLEQAVEQDLEQVKKAFATAETDVELWKMLHDKVLSRVYPLGLDNPAPKRSPKQHKRKTNADKEAEKESTPTATASPQWPGNMPDKLVITRTLPEHVAECGRLLFFNFPSSHLHSSLLPYLKSLGPATFALAASTKLYNQHMRSLFRTHHNLPQIVRTLDEMDKEVYEFDDKSKDFVDSIGQRSDKARTGTYGPGVRALWRGERFRRGAKAISFWSTAIEKRLQEKALREARAQEAEDMAKEEEADHEQALA